MKRKLQEKGITLVALVVTIIILLILAGVTIGAITSNTGLLSRTQQAKAKYENASQNELSDINTITSQIDEYAGANSQSAIVSVQEIADAISGASATADTAKQYIGKAVTYKGDSNWEIFYAGNKFSSDGSTHVYLISKTNRGNTTFSSTYSSGDASKVISDASKLCSWFKTYSTSTNSNAKSTYYMLTSSNYSTYLDSTVANWTIGGPTEDIFIESYNKYYGKTYTYATDGTDYNSTGYIYNRKGTGAQANTSLYDNNSISNDGAPYNRGYYYWLASPSYGSTYNLRLLYFYSAALNDYSYNNTIGLRPLVSLKSGVTLTSTGDGIYTVQ